MYSFFWGIIQMLVGEPGSGKTSLMNNLFDKNYLVPDIFLGKKQLENIELITIYQKVQLKNKIFGFT